ncbi:hypothetical protein PMAYCL1PPCAC_22806, partial [Pristionchus mayeri]
TQFQFNVFFSFIGYILFCLIIYGSFKKGVIWRHIHDVFLILGFAFITDMIETRMHLFFIFNFQTCTIAQSLIDLHYSLTYVEAIISIHRLIVNTCAKRIPVYYVYFGLTSIFSVKV